MGGFERLAEQLCAALRAHLSSGLPPVLPEAGTLLWNAFGELSASRSYHAAGPNPIAWSEIAAWARLNRCPLERHHVAVIRALDRAWIEQTMAASRRHPHDTDTSGRLPIRSGQKLTAELFDLVTG